MTLRLQPLNCFPAAARQRVRYVLCDIDDTLTLDGHLTASAFVTIERLARAGFGVVPVTGRPAGWCDLIARQWPVAGVVGENGAFYFSYDRGARRVRRRYWFDDARRRLDRERLAELERHVEREVAGARAASDQRYRETDLAIDWCEDATDLAEAEVARIVALAEAAGATVRVSSIHVNIWFGDFSKLAMARLLIEDLFALDAERDAPEFVFVGDSPNDVSMFAFFPNSVGVANVLKFRTQLDVPPAYVTEAPGGDGFAELGEALLAAR
jgi:HAD superfamily hydrolase (TIGR01484 family)